MTLMFGKLHATLIQVGVPEEQARAAAEEVAAHRAQAPLLNGGPWRHDPMIMG